MKKERELRARELFPTLAEEERISRIYRLVNARDPARDLLRLPSSLLAWHVPRCAKVPHIPRCHRSDAAQKPKQRHRYRQPAMIRPLAARIKTPTHAMETSTLNIEIEGLPPILCTCMARLDGFPAV